MESPRVTHPHFLWLAATSTLSARILNAKILLIIPVVLVKIFSAFMTFSELVLFFQKAIVLKGKRDIVLVDMIIHSHYGIERLNDCNSFETSASDLFGNARQVV